MRIAPFEERNVALLAGASLLPFAGFAPVIRLRCRSKSPHMVRGFQLGSCGRAAMWPSVQCPNRFGSMKRKWFRRCYATAAYALRARVDAAPPLGATPPLGRVRSMGIYKVLVHDVEPSNDCANRTGTAHRGGLSQVQCGVCALPREGVGERGCHHRRATNLPWHRRRTTDLPWHHRPYRYSCRGCRKLWWRPRADRTRHPGDVGRRKTIRFDVPELRRKSSCAAITCAGGGFKRFAIGVSLRMSLNSSIRLLGTRTPKGSRASTGSQAVRRIGTEVRVCVRAVDLLVAQ
jgi:hypothetical protein